MAMFKRVGLFILISWFSLFALATVYITAATSTVTPNNIKTWLSDNDIYSSLLDSAISSSNEVDLGTEDLEEAIGKVMVNDAIKRTFTPAVLKNISEQFIDGTNDWLTGKADKPSFSVDLKTLKSDFANNVGVVVEENYLKLPLCKEGQTIDPDNLLGSECRVAEVSIEPVKAFIVNSVLEDKEFLPDPVLNADNLYLDAASKERGETAFDELNNVPKIYQVVNTSKYVVGSIALLSALLLVFASKSRRKGLKRVAVPLLSVGVFLLISVFIVNGSIDKAESNIKADNKTDQIIKNDITLPLLKEVKSSLNSTILVFSIIYIVTSAGILTYLFMTKKPKHPQQEPVANEEVPGGGDKPPEQPPQAVTPEAPKAPDNSKKV